MRNRVQKVLDRSGVRVGGILSDIFARNGRRILDGLARGLDHNTILASLSHHVVHKLDRLGDALRLSVSAVERLLLCDLLAEHDALQQRIQGLDRDIDTGLEPWRERIGLLQTIPGIDRPSACAILAEIGPDLDAFANAERLAASTGLCPGNSQSAGKRRATRSRMGSKALRAVLVECAHGAARTQGCQFRGYHKALMVRRGYKRAIVATAHKLLRVLYVVLRDARPYHDPEADYEQLMVRRNAPRWIRMLHRYALNRAPRPPRPPDTLAGSQCRRHRGHIPGPPEARLRLQPPRTRCCANATPRRHGYARPELRALSRQRSEPAIRGDQSLARLRRRQALV